MTTAFIKGINYKIIILNKAIIFDLLYDIDHVMDQYFIVINFKNYKDYNGIIYANCYYYYLLISGHKTEHDLTLKFPKYKS